jgi:hypothetical protein
MKTKTTFLLQFIIGILFFNTSLAQDWEWEWVNTATSGVSNMKCDVLHVDKNNVAYCRTNYDTILYVGDTSFQKPLEYAETTSTVFSKYDADGNFINALDLYSLPGLSVANPNLVTDSELNIYLSSSFQEKVFINDSSVSLINPPEPNSNAVFLTKLTADFEMDWAGLIVSNGTNVLKNLLIAKDNGVFIACNHKVDNNSSSQVDFFGQQSSQVFDADISSVCKLDRAGALIWKKELKSDFKGTDCKGLIIGEDSLLYFVGECFGDISIDGNILHHPFYPSIKSATFLAVFDQNGVFEYGKFLIDNFTFSSCQAGINGDFYIAGAIVDTTIVGNDTIVTHEDEFASIIVHYNKLLQPVWYEDFYNYYPFRLFLDNDNLVFTTFAGRGFNCADTIFYFGWDKEIIIGEYNNKGTLTQIMTTDCSLDALSSYNVMDNCKNLIIGGTYCGKSIGVAILCTALVTLFRMALWQDY